MGKKPQPLSIKTGQSRQVVDITNQVQELVDKSAAMCTVFVAHTTCAVTTADLDPGTDLDLLDAVWEIIPQAQVPASAQSDARAGPSGQFVYRAVGQRTGG